MKENELYLKTLQNNYRKWQNTFSITWGIPYGYMKELGDHWFKIIYGEMPNEEIVLENEVHFINDKNEV